MKLGIDASRSRSGGAKAHMLGILANIDALPQDITEVHLWAYDSLLDSLPEYGWLVKHSPRELNKNLLVQIWWQYKKLPGEAKRAGVDIMLNTDAGTVSRFMPSVTMSRDMLSYEDGEMKRFGFGFQRFRLLALKYVQNYSLKKYTPAILHTKYASDVIQKSSGKIERFKIIPHGASPAFRIDAQLWKNSDREKEPVKCVYVSNVAPYKHQWHVAEAVASLVKKGHNLTIDFVGGGEGKAQERFLKCVQELDPERKFIKQLEFVKHNMLPQLIKNADLFIFASSCENMPNTLIEGMCSGLPIVCSDRGPMPEVLQDAGIYFNPEDSKSIADSIEYVLINEEERNRNAVKSKQLSEQYNWERCRKETFQYLIEVYKGEVIK